MLGLPLVAGLAGDAGGDAAQFCRQLADQAEFDLTDRSRGSRSRQRRAHSSSIAAC
jgi:hypothetical protein